MTCKHETWLDSAEVECVFCGADYCPYGEPLHWHHDGCPACYDAHKRQPDKGEAIRVAFYGGSPED
jgi:hypothetical protein